MSFFSDLRHTPAATKPPGTITDHNTPMMNLSSIKTRMDTLHELLSDSVNSNTLLGQPKMNMISSEISSAIHQVIINGAALLSSSIRNPDPKQVKPELELDDSIHTDYDIVEMDAVELLAEHVHFCEICGKGFKRDANLRMHMRAHGNQFKTVEALAKPDKSNGDGDLIGRRVRFSCPYVGCNRNKGHKKFRPLKSVICVKNHFKRSHCPKMYSCTRCNKKSFSVLADLKSHLKHCGESKWRCSCGTSFSRKDKLFGHMTLFEGHMPALGVEAEAVVMVDEEEEDEKVMNVEMECYDGSEGIVKTSVLEGIENYNWIENMLDSPNSASSFGSEMEVFFNL